MTHSTMKDVDMNNVVTLHDPERERREGELAVLAHELAHRAEQGAPSAHHTAKLARRIAEIADTLT